MRREKTDIIEENYIYSLYKKGNIFFVEFYGRPYAEGFSTLQGAREHIYYTLH